MFDPLYVRQAKLLLRCLPEIKRHACFALKGGTAINLFFRPMPRLSVDIDLTYLPPNHILSKCLRSAMATASVRVEAPSLLQIRAMCCLTALAEIFCDWAI